MIEESPTSRPSREIWKGLATSRIFPWLPSCRALRLPSLPPHTSAFTWALPKVDTVLDTECLIPSSKRLLRINWLFFDSCRKTKERCQISFRQGRHLRRNAWNCALLSITGFYHVLKSSDTLPMDMKLVDFSCPHIFWQNWTPPHFLGVQFTSGWN